MSERQRIVGIVVLFLLLLYSKGGSGLPFVEPKADSLWIVALDDLATRTPKQTIALDADKWVGPNRKYEHYWKPSTEAERYTPFSKFADEVFFQDADTGKVLGVVEIPTNPPDDWAKSQIARFAQ